MSRMGSLRVAGQLPTICSFQVFAAAMDHPEAQSWRLAACQLGGLIPGGPPNRR